MKKTRKNRKKAQKLSKSRAFLLKAEEGASLIRVNRPSYSASPRQEAVETLEYPREGKKMLGAVYIGDKTRAKKQMNQLTIPVTASHPARAGQLALATKGVGRPLNSSIPVQPVEPPFVISVQPYFASSE